MAKGEMMRGKSSSRCLCLVLGATLWPLAMPANGEPLAEAPVELSEISIKQLLTTFQLANTSASTIRLERIVLSRGVSDDQAQEITACCLYCMAGWYSAKQGEITIASEGIEVAKETWMVSLKSPEVVRNVVLARTMYAPGCTGPLFAQVEVLGSALIAPKQTLGVATLRYMDQEKLKQSTPPFVINRLVADKNQLCLFAYFENYLPKSKCWLPAKTERGPL